MPTLNGRSESERTGNPVCPEHFVQFIRQEHVFCSFRPFIISNYLVSCITALGLRSRFEGRYVT